MNQDTNPRTEEFKLEPTILNHPENRRAEDSVAMAQKSDGDHMIISHENEQTEKASNEGPLDRTDKPAEFSEAELRQLLLKDENFKEMKCCGDIIEKMGGCNRIECSCGKQICWVCLEIFNEKDECYSHLAEKHGGFYDENEIENLIQSGAKKLLCCGNLAFKEDEELHVHCPICKKHSCWLCLTVFASANECYKHINISHREKV